MDNNRLLYDSFNIYYDKGMSALEKGDLDSAHRNIFSAAESLLKMAKASSGQLKAKRLKRASQLMDLANKISESMKKQSLTENKTKDKDLNSSVKVTTNANITLSTALKNLNSLIGLESVKKQINDWVEQIKVFNMREKENLPIPPMSYHLIFTGNPGTGKTTVARIIAQIYCALGITKTANFVEVDRSDLVAGYVGQTAIKTKEVINKALGGVLFIDEAYTLSNRGHNDFGQEAIDTLLKEMEDNRNNLVVITAGYENLMEGFINTNPGLKSRFKTYIKFDDYTKDELYEIFIEYCNNAKYKLDSSAQSIIKNVIGNMFENRNSLFGNGREMRNLFEKVVTCQSKRVSMMKNPSVEDLITIKSVDLDEFNVSNNNSNNEVRNNIVHNIKDGVDKDTRNNIVHNIKDIELKDNSPESKVLNDENNDNESEYKFEWNALPVITFDDVAGLENVKEEVKNKVLLPILNPEAFEGYKKKNGGGLLLFGAPGTGKTMIASAIANEIGANFCSVKPSDLIHQGAGNTEKAVRSLFAQARKFKCAVIYFDEMDSIAQKDTRSTYAKQMRSELLAQLQGVESYGKETGNILYLIAATNKPWEMDSAFVRPGRFGTRIYVGLPDIDSRKYMINKRIESIKQEGIVTICNDIDVDNIVDKTNGFNGADMTNLLDKVEEISILRSIEGNSKYINNSDFEQALTLIKSTVQKEDIEKLNKWMDENNIL